MKQSVKKSVRYIYASVLAGVLFLIFYVLIRLSFVLSLVGMLGAYVAGIFLFRKKDVISYDPKLLMEYSFEASRIQNFATQFQEEGVVKDLKSICQTSEKLLNMLEQKKEKATQLYRFFDYYLDLTLAFCTQYKMLLEKPSLTDKEQELVDNIPTYFSHIKEQFDKQVENMYRKKMIDMEEEIRLFKKLVPVPDKSKEGE